MRIRKNKKLSYKAKRLFIVSLAFLCITLLVSWGLDNSEPVILPLAESLFKDKVTNTVYSVISDISFNNIIIPCYTEDGRISSVQTDTAALNLITKEIVTKIDSELAEKDINIKIPIGDLLGTPLALGQGPYIVVQMNQYKSTDAEIISEFTQNGINQTLHKLTLRLCVETVVLIPGPGTEKIKAEILLPLSETLIVGQSPDTYFENSFTYPVR
ncbi:MAG: hypothetical protein IKU52_08705 [Clostridia bacterium]|nr:hypothetical protein [Clostridia bacterium]